MATVDFPVFRLMNRADCCACEACANSCPKGIITFQEDEEGFRFPHIDNSKCIECSACVRVCPRLKEVKKDVGYRKCLAGYAKDEEIVLGSSSGGIYSCLVEAFLASYENAYYCGVIWNDGFDGASFYLSDDINDLEKVKLSKYVQAEKGDIYRRIKAALTEGKNVLFTGCPCEAAALKSYLKNEYDNLYTVDLVCKGPTSAKVLNEYFDTITKKERPTYVNLRVVGGEKWIPQWMRIRYRDHREVFKSFYKTPLGQAFQILQREACYTCKFCGANRYSDLTLGDFHGADPQREYYNPNGTSILIENTEKGSRLIDSVRDVCVFENVTYEEISAHNPRVEESWEPDVRRPRFAAVFREKGLIPAYRAVTPLKKRAKLSLSNKKAVVLSKLKGRVK